MANSSAVSYLDSIVGHSPTVELLRQALSNSRLPHAMLFSGPPAVGKQTTARAFAADCLMGFSKEGQEPAVRLNFEKLFSTGGHPDFHILSVEPGKKEISVEQVRTLCKALQLKPYYPGCKVAVIDRAHCMSIAACNSLLMTLEEPPADTYIILVSEASHRLPQTIASRCQIVHFGYLIKDEIKRILVELLKAIDVNTGLIDRLVKITDGTLLPLCLGEFVDLKTMLITDPSSFETHLSNLSLRSEGMQRQLLRFYTDSSSAVSLASNFAKDKELGNILWATLREFARCNLISSSPEALCAWANALNRLLEAEQLVRERNASLDLQLSSVLLEMRDAQALGR